MTAAVSFEPSAAPKLMVVVDTEEAFDWSKPHRRSEINVDHIVHQRRAQDIFARYGVKPTYVVDYPVASQEAGYRPLREWLVDGLCEIGAHLHPWVNPPFDEEVNARNSYPGNLLEPLERAKLAHLTDVIESNFEHRPRIYKAGRYGIGPATGTILEQLGYRVDTSVVPGTDFGSDGGPNFTGLSADPFWFGPSRAVLELPLTVGWLGRLARLGRTLQPMLASGGALRLHVPGLCARLGLFERIRLTPEGATLAELKRLTESMLSAGHRLFNFTYHSPSLAPGNTPYVRNEAELEAFLGVIDGYCAYFFGKCKGSATTTSDIWRALADRRACKSISPTAPRVA